MDPSFATAPGGSPLVSEEFKFNFSPDQIQTEGGRGAPTGSLSRPNQGPGPFQAGRGHSGHPQTDGYPTQNFAQGYPSGDGRGYPSQRGGYPSQRGGYPSQRGGYPGQTGGYYSGQTGGYPGQTQYVQIPAPYTQYLESTGYPAQVPRSDSFQIRSLSPKVGEQTPAQAEERRACCVSTVKVLAIAFIAAALFAGLIGTLVYTGVMDVGLLNCGTMTTEAGLYTLLAGFGSAVVASVVYTILTCNKCETKEPDESGGFNAGNTQITGNSAQTRQGTNDEPSTEAEADLSNLQDPEDLLPTDDDKSGSQDPSDHHSD